MVFSQKSQPHPNRPVIIHSAPGANSPNGPQQISSAQLSNAHRLTPSSPLMQQVAPKLSSPQLQQQQQQQIQRHGSKGEIPSAVNTPVTTPHMNQKQHLTSDSSKSNSTGSGGSSVVQVKTPYVAEEQSAEVIYPEAEKVTSFGKDEDVEMYPGSVRISSTKENQLDKARHQNNSNEGFKQQLQVQQQQQPQQAQIHQQKPMPPVPKSSGKIARQHGNQLTLSEQERRREIRRAKEKKYMARLLEMCSTADPHETYQDLVKIGQGASGGVYTAYDTQTGECVAIKQMELERQPKKELIINEILVMKGSQHKNIVNFIDAYLYV
ncbi:unnamed protein product [Ambrosiozyma monospora]|uniref:Unnamed protein product n=1 Tax=Ambrosiozyma monospora TaxID=43982 RepID=A0ACB5U482_AMBMO|nr:unnamed protein product [Ambrosiozyma monospora]